MDRLSNADKGAETVSLLVGQHERGGVAVAKAHDDFMGYGSWFVTLVLAAQDHPELGRQLLAILSLVNFNRRSLLNGWIQELRLQPMTRALVQALLPLTDSAIAGRTISVLQEKIRGEIGKCE